jgi:hypothetical protein
MAAYIILANSNASLTKHFRVLASGYQPVREKMGARRITVTGKVDNQVGPVTRRWRYRLKVYATDPDAGDYGTLANLKTFFGYTDPGGVPSNVITFTDVDDVAHSIYFVGTLSERNITPSLTGTTGLFHIDIEMQKTEAE